MSAVIRANGAQVARIDRFRIGHWLLVRVISALVPFLFDGSQADGIEASFELRMPRPSGSADDVRTLHVSGGRCKVLVGPTPDAPARFTVGADDIVRMSSGVIGWPQLVSSKRLVLWGDPYLVVRLPIMLGLPARRGEPSLLRLLRLPRLPSVPRGGKMTRSK